MAVLLSSPFIHSKDKMPIIWNKYSQKRNIGVSVPISTFMCLWANYIFPRWVCLFCRRKYVDRSWEYINRSQTHECGNWGWGRAIPRKGIYNRNWRCSVWEKYQGHLRVRYRQNIKRIPTFFRLHLYTVFTVSHATTIIATILSFLLVFLLSVAFFTCFIPKQLKLELWTAIWLEWARYYLDS